MKLKNTQPVAILSFLFIFLACSLFTLADDGLSLNKSVFKDSDGDGLSDGEEQIYGTDPSKADTDGDGYSDGVEVKSGYNPLKPAPGDKIILVGESAVLGESTSAEEENMTAQLSDKLAEFIKENEGKEGSLSVEDLDTIIDESLGDEMSQNFSILIDESLIKIKNQDYSRLSAEERTAREKEDATAYFKTVLYILISNAPGKITSEEELNVVLEEFAVHLQGLLEESAIRDKDYFADLTERGQKVLEELSFVEVPEKLLELHKEGLLFSVQALELNKLTIDPNDSIGLIVNLSKVNNVIEQGYAFQENFTLKMDEYRIENMSSLIFGN